MKKLSNTEAELKESVAYKKWETVMQNLLARIAKFLRFSPEFISANSHLFSNSKIIIYYSTLFYSRPFSIFAGDKFPISMISA